MRLGFRDVPRQFRRYATRLHTQVNFIARVSAKGWHHPIARRGRIPIERFAYVHGAKAILSIFCTRQTIAAAVGVS
jgi:hypothetical protein